MSFFKHKTVSQKLNTATVSIALLFAAVMAVSIICITIQSRDFDSFYQNEYSVALARGDFALGNQGAGKSATKMILASQSKDAVERQKMEQYYQEGQKFQQLMGESMMKIKQSGIADEADLNALMQKQAAMKDQYEAMYALCRAGQGEAAWLQYERQYSPVGQDIRNTMDSVLEDAAQSAQRHLDSTHRLQYLLYIAAFITLLVLALLLYAITSGLKKTILVPIRELEDVTHRLSHGELDCPVNYNEQNEFGELAEAFRQTNHMLSVYFEEISAFTEAISQGRLNYQPSIEFKGDFSLIKASLEKISLSLSKAMSQISVSAEQVTRGAEQIASAGQALSQSTVEQASSVTELAATINTVSGHIQENASNAMAASSRSNQVSQEVAESSRNLDAINDAMHAMKDMSGEIAGIVKNIEEIAFQTNILSLNAAVEAARAGDAGRGFAVIAREIRQLAGNSSEASKNTSQLIDKTIQMISDCASRTEKAAAMLGKVSGEVQNTTGMIDGISTASNNQATSIAQIRQSIDMISEVIQENSATAEESAASSEELMGQMRMLKKLVQSFEFRKE